MSFIRVLLASIFISIAIYTIIVVSNHGFGLFPIFFGDIAKMEWPGQFNFDFLCFLFLSGVWVAWRHKFSPGGLALGLVAFLGGAFFLSGYLFVESFRRKGSIEGLLLGARRE